MRAIYYIIDRGVRENPGNPMWMLLIHTLAIILSHIFFIFSAKLLLPYRQETGKLPLNRYVQHVTCLSCNNDAVVSLPVSFLS